MKSIAFAALLVCTGLGTSRAARAEAFVVDDYQIDITVRPEAELEISERIQVTFSEPRHGIDRRIPVTYESFGSVPGGERASRPVFTGGRYSYAFSDVQVEGDPFEVARFGDNERIRIGSANRTVTGPKTYLIRYRIYGGVNFFSDHSELYWNLVGNAWDTVIRAVHFTIHLPSEYSVPKADYFLMTGAYGSRETAATVEVLPGLFSGQTSRALGPRESVTVGIRFPKGFLKEGSLFLKLKLWAANYPFWYVPILTFLLAFSLWRWVGPKRVRPIAVAYYPPQGATPAEMGLLIDDAVDNRDLTAMIFDWGARGFLTITEVKGFLSTDYRLTRLKPLPPAPESHRYERILFDSIFRPGDTVLVSDRSGHIYSEIADARSNLEDEYEPKLYVASSLRLRTSMRALGIACCVLGGIFFLLKNPPDLSGGVFWLVSSLPLFLFARGMARKSELGGERYAQLLGFQEFMNRVEKPRLELMLKEDPKYFEKTLAYAVVLGIGERWARQWDGLIASPPTWYVGSDANFSTYRLMNSMSAANSHMGSQFAHQPSQSGSGGSGFSGGGGGGFSGGGGGGGGGSSW